MSSGPQVQVASSRRTVLFLQCVASPFFFAVARSLERQGCIVRKINVCLGDALFWRLKGENYRGDIEGWRGFLAEYLHRHQVTDICLFGDERAYHKVAISLAGVRQIQVHVFEEGYLRPHWITLDRDGANANSSFPRCPETILARAALGGEQLDNTEVDAKMSLRAGWDIAFHAANITGRWLYPGYRHHRPDHPLSEFRGWLKRLAVKRWAERHAEAEIKRLRAHPQGFFLVPLQLDSDSQIRKHSRFASVGAFQEEVFASFSRAAAVGVKLLVKVHPLDNGLIDRKRQTRELAEKYGIADRVSCIDGGPLNAILKAALGVIVVNSTVGVTALTAGKPVTALGKAMYDIPGMTFAGALDDFWTNPTVPDPALVEAYRRTIIRETQINGNYFCRKTMAEAAERAAHRIGEAATRRRPIGQQATSQQPFNGYPAGVLALAPGE